MNLDLSTDERNPSSVTTIKLVAAPLRKGRGRLNQTVSSSYGKKKQLYVTDWNLCDPSASGYKFSLTCYDLVGAVGQPASSPGCKSLYSKADVPGGYFLCLLSDSEINVWNDCCRNHVCLEKCRRLAIHIILCKSSLPESLQQLSLYISSNTEIFL